MFLSVTMELLRGFWETVQIFALTLVFSLPLGLVVAFGSMSKFQPLKWLIPRGQLNHRLSCAALPN